jgi:hypothetical protein
MSDVVVSPKCGGYGCVFSFDDDPRWALKLTSDQTDAAAAAWIMNTPGARRYSAIPDVRFVFALRRRDLFEDIGFGRMSVYRIVLPTLYPLDKWQSLVASQFAKDILWYAEEVASGQGGWGEYRLQRAGLDDFPQANEFARGVAFLASHGLVIYDMARRRNILANRRGDWVLADLGWSRAPSIFVPYLNRDVAADVLVSIARPPKHSRPRRELGSRR